MTSRKNTLSRRTMLRGILAGGAAVAVGLPALEIFLNDSGTALADGDLLPKRFGIFFWGNGGMPSRWVPEKTGADWELTELLAPFAEVQENVTVVSGVRLYTPNIAPHSGVAGILSGAPYPGGDMTTFGLPSIDQVIAQAVGQTTRFRSLEVSVQQEGIGQSYNGPHSVNPPETSPLMFFQRVFGVGFTPPGSTPVTDPRLKLRASILDAISSDAKRMQGKLGASDKARLDQHLEGIHQLEQQIQTLEDNPPLPAACSVPAMPNGNFQPVNGRFPLSAMSRAMVDVMVMALACDQTRVFSHWFCHPTSNLLYPDTLQGHHQLTHVEPGDQPQVRSILLYLMTEFAYLVKALREVPEGDGTLRDRCAVFGTSDCSEGFTHALDSEYPILVAGSCGGALKQGIHYRSPSDESASKVLLTLARAMGLPLEQFGEGPGQVFSSLSGIEA